MFLRKRPDAVEEAPIAPLPAMPIPAGVYRVGPQQGGGHEDLKRAVHARLLDEPEILNAAGDALTPEAADLLRRLLAEAALKREDLITRAKLEQIHADMVDEIRGLGPLEPLMADPTVTEIMVNGPHQVYVEQGGRLLRTGIRFENAKHLNRIIDRVVSRVGRHIDDASPLCDARLPDGSRVNAVIQPLAIDGPVLTIRRFAREPLTAEILVERGAMSPAIALFLRRAVEGKLNVIVSGGTGSGKTTVLNVLSAFIPGNERLITIEDAAELQLQQPHVVRLETRQPNIEGIGGISQADLLRNTLRMRPDRIIIGEVRGGEALAMLQAMNTGHEGSLTTVHSNGCREALSRLETMVLMAGFDLPHRAIREQVSSALDLVIQVERSVDGRRRLTSVSEVVGMEGDVYLLQELFTFRITGHGPSGELLGTHVPTGIVPRANRRLEEKGLGLPASLFQVGGAA